MKVTYTLLATFLFLTMISCGQNEMLASPKKTDHNANIAGNDSIVIDHRLDSCKKIAEINSNKYELISSCNDLILSKNITNIFTKSRYEVREVKVCIFRYHKHPDILKISLNGEIENYRRLTAKWSTYKLNITGIPEVNNHKKFVLKNKSGDVSNFVTYDKEKRILKIKQKTTKKYKLLRSFTVKCEI